MYDSHVAFYLLLVVLAIIQMVHRSQNSLFWSPSCNMNKCESVAGWLVVFGLNDPLRQYFSLYRVVSQREGEREEKG